jgi:hypothetical protein
VKIDLGDGSYLEPDEGSRNTEFHMRIVAIEPVPNTRSGNYLTLECGHRTMAFGDLKHAGGVVLCSACRDKWRGR